MPNRTYGAHAHVAGWSRVPATIAVGSAGSPVALGVCLAAAAWAGVALTAARSRERELVPA